MSKPVLKSGVLLVLFSLCWPARAELTLFDSMLSGPSPYLGATRYESSADILVQLPALVDPRSPVPLGVRVFQDNVESITLLSDEVDPVRLASFNLGAGVKPEISTRFRAWSGGLLVVVRTDSRIFAARRAYTLTAEPIAKAEEDTAAVAEHADQSDTGGQLGSSALPSIGGEIALVASTAEAAPLSLEQASVGQAGLEAMELRAWRSKELNYVELRLKDPLSKRIESLDEAAVNGVRISRFELSLSDRVVLSGDLGDRLWFEPYFRFSLSDGKAGDRLVLNWWGSDGESGELATRIDDSG